MRKLIVMIVCCFVYGCASVPKAPELNFPENAHAVVCNMDQQVRNSLNEDQSTELIKMLEGMIPTNKQSIHDRPVQKLDYYIELSHEREEVLYFYSENGKYYAELPYTGIYECHEDFYKSLNEISSVEETKKAVRINEKLYLCTDEIISEIRCGVMDGVISSAIESYRYPIENDQSNFGTGYGYQYGSREGTIEIFMNDQWFIFATEEVRNQIQFPKEEMETIRFHDKVFQKSDLSEETIKDYIKTKESLDKAGAYAIQGKFCVFIDKMEGSYFSTIGLPVHQVYDVIKKYI